MATIYQGTQQYQYQPFENASQDQQQFINGQLTTYQMQPITTEQQQYVVIPVKTGLQKLAESQGIYIKQKFEPFEVITGCETPNVYKVYPGDASGKQIGNNEIFKCKEKSNCFQRNCLSADCRPFNMKVSNEQGTITNGNLCQTQFLSLERPFRCTFCCLERPVLEVFFIENGLKTFFGRIKNPCLFGTLGCNVEDVTGNVKYLISGTACQLGCLCRCIPFKDCQEFLFEIKNPTGDVVARLQKQSPGCMKALVSNTDNFALGFPIDCTAEDKALLMSAALFLDYMYFENKKQVTTNTTNKFNINFN